VALIERDKSAAETLRQNSRKVLGIDPALVKEEDATTINFIPFVGKVDLLTAGPPCQPFSTGGKSKGYDDPRNMFPILLDAITSIMPQGIFVENVKGLLREKFTDSLKYILKRIEFPLARMKKGETWRDHYARLLKLKESDFPEQERYIVGYQLVDTADFGIPQRRERVFISAFRRDLGIYPVRIEPTHSKQSLLSSQWITREYWERNGVKGNPPDDHLSGKDQALLKEMRKKTNRGEDGCVSTLPWVTVREAISGLPKPVLRGEEPTLANHVQHPGARIYRFHTGSYFDYPAKALKAGTNGTPGGENVLRISPVGEVRYFTTREAARLHTFPDQWVFSGVWGACIKQLGNAVPVKIIEKFANEIRHRLENFSHINASYKNARQGEKVQCGQTAPLPEEKQRPQNSVSDSWARATRQ
jgi:DNA (cytosine-5)-methyltransferase 1